MHITQWAIDTLAAGIGIGGILVGLGVMIEAIGMSKFFHAQAWEIKNA